MKSYMYFFLQNTEEAFNVVHGGVCQNDIQSA